MMPRRVNLALTIIGVTLLVAWFLAAALLPIPTALSSTSGAVVSSGADVRLQARSDAQVETVEVTLGQPVAKGDVLLRFDVDALQAELASKRAQLERLDDELASLRAQADILDPRLVSELEALAGELESTQTRRAQALRPNRIRTQGQGACMPSCARNVESISCSTKKRRRTLRRRSWSSKRWTRSWRSCDRARR